MNNRRRYDHSDRFTKSSDSYNNRKEYGNSRIGNSNSKDDYRSGGRYQNSSRYFEEKKYSSNFRNSYSSNRSGDNRVGMKRSSRNDDSRLNSGFLSTHRRNDIRPKTPPPPTIRSSGYNRGSGSHHRNNDSIGHRNSYSPTRRRQYIQHASRNNTHRYNPRIRNAIRRDNDARPKVIRRKIIVSSSRKLSSFRNDRSRIIRLARIKRNRDSMKSKTTPTKKSSRENENISDDEKKSKNTSSSNNDREELEDNVEEKSTKNTGPDEQNMEEDDDCEIGEQKLDKETNDKIDVGDLKKPNEDNSSTRNRSSKRESVSPDRKTKPFIKLICVHCRIKCRTFSEYQNHLYSRTHRMAMRRVSIRQKMQLSRMRLEQRNAQRQLEENSKEDLGEQQYCLLCRLNYKTGKAKHQISDHHKTMKKFLMPYCSTCHIAFKSPTVYQSHRCSLDHIKRKARDNKSDSDDSGNEMKVDLKDFTTVDSIGEIDNDDLDESADDLNISEADNESLGIKFVKKVEALYCQICENYLCHDIENEENIVLKHCRTKIHLKLSRNITQNCSDETADELNTSKQLDDSAISQQLDENSSTEIKAETCDLDVELKNENIIQENNDEEYEDDETILNIDILSEKNCKDNELIDETNNGATE